MQQPVPMLTLFPPPPPKKNESVDIVFEVCPDGTFSITKNIESIAYCYMLPLFGCYGCCMPNAKSVRIVFNDYTQTISISEWYPLTRICPEQHVYKYPDVANVGYMTVINGSRNGRVTSKTLKPMIITTDRKTYEFGQPTKDIEKGKVLVLSLHRFVFGRGLNSSTYTGRKWGENVYLMCT